MITAWQIYWVMQLDNILAVTSTISFFATSFGGIAYLAHRVAKTSGREDDEAKLIANATWISKPMLAVGLLCIAANAFLPSSKTAAAMIVLPAITSDKVIETVTPEARELYELAKDALRSVSKKETAADAPKDAAK